MKKKMNLRIITLVFFSCFSIVASTLYGQSVVAVQGQAGFLMCTKTGQIYSVNANTGTAKLITTAPSGLAINSLVTDTIRGLIYYCDNSYISTNRSIYGYNYRTNTHFTLINDFATAPGSPLVGLGGVGTAGAAFYNGDLFFGVELARSLSPGVPSIGANNPYADRLYKVSLDAAGTSITATSLLKDFYNDNGYTNYSSTAFGSTVSSFYQYDHNWGDFIIINDTLFDRSVKGYTSGSFFFEQYTTAYDLSAPAAQLYNTLTLPATTVLNDGFSYVQAASDGFGNLILVGNEGNANQYFVIADKTTGTYVVASAKPLTVNGTPFAQAVTDCGNVIKGEGTIGNIVWNDVNENGIRDVSETGISDVPVELWEDINSDGIIDIAADKLLGTAITDNAGNYGFINVMQGNYLARCVLTSSVNYPAQGFSASYFTNPLSNGSARLIDAGDETIGGSNNVNLINRSFSSLNFNDQINDFGFADVYGLLAFTNCDLKASLTNQAVKLDWELLLTGNEFAYAIERSIDGLLFNTIINGTIISSGTTISTTDWDRRLPTGISWLYYRLTITDKNGHQKVSRAVKVKIQTSDKEQATVYPNPAKNKTTLLIPQSLIHKLLYVTISNSSGQQVRKFVIDSAREMETINISEIKAGTYYWRVNTENKKQAVYNGKLEIF